jgi:hypothetical protein
MSQDVSPSGSKWWVIAVLAFGCSSAQPPLAIPEVSSIPSTPSSGTSARASHGAVAHGGWYPDARNGLRIPGGEVCVSWLRNLGIPFERLPPKPGIETPIEVTGPIGGIQYVSEGKESIVCDCRLALALDWSSRVLRPLGVDRVAHRGAYVNRTTRRGRPSLHARGLAIDVGAVRVGNEWLEVDRDFRRNTHPRCDANLPLLNSVSCQLRTLRLFRELITPDDDGDHHDHLHLALPLRPR